jgi:hypothetical protein
MNNPIKVLLAAPSYDGRYDVRFMDSLINTITLCENNNIKVLPYFLCFDSLIQRARNDYFRVAYQSGVDVMFFIDSDIGWNPSDFVKLVLSEKDMIGGTYRKKNDDEELYAFKALGENATNFNIIPDNDGLLEVNGLGCGFLKLSKNCVTKLFENEVEFYTSDKEGSQEITKNVCACTINRDKHFVSEDIIMGFKWQQLGGKVYLDTTINLVHVGNKAYVGNVQNWLHDWKTKFEMQNSTKPTNRNEILSKYFVSPFQENPSDDDMFKVL